MKLEIIRATVIVGDGCDKVYLKTGLPEAVWPFGRDGDVVSLSFSAAHGTGLDYLRKHMPELEVNFIDIKDHVNKVVKA